MNGRVLRQAVGDEDAHPVAFDHFDRWAGALSVVTPQVGIHAGSDLPHNRLGHKVKLLDALVHAPRQRPAVEGDHRVIGPTGAGDASREMRRRRVRILLQDEFRKCGHGDGTDRGRGHGATGQAQALDECATGCHRVSFRFSDPDGRCWPGKCAWRRRGKACRSGPSVDHSGQSSSHAGTRCSCSRC